MVVLVTVVLGVPTCRAVLLDVPVVVVPPVQDVSGCWEPWRWESLRCWRQCWLLAFWW